MAMLSFLRYRELSFLHYMENTLIQYFPGTKQKPLLVSMIMDCIELPLHVSVHHLFASAGLAYYIIWRTH